MNSVGVDWFMKSEQLGEEVTCKRAIATKHGMLSGEAGGGPSPESVERGVSFI